MVVAQIRTGEFGTVNGEMRWITNYSNLTNVRIVSVELHSVVCQKRLFHDQLVSGCVSFCRLSLFRHCGFLMLARFVN